MGVQLRSVTTWGRQDSSVCRNRAAEFPRSVETKDKTGEVDSTVVIAVKVIDVKMFPGT